MPEEQIGLIHYGGISTVVFDTAQAQEDGYAEYELRMTDATERYRTRTVSIGDDIPRVVVDDAIAKLPDGLEVVGLVVSDYQLAKFIQVYPEMEIYRQRE